MVVEVCAPAICALDGAKLSPFEEGQSELGLTCAQVKRTIKVVTEQKNRSVEWLRAHPHRGMRFGRHGYGLTWIDGIVESRLRWRDSP